MLASCAESEVVYIKKFALEKKKLLSKNGPIAKLNFKDISRRHDVGNSMMPNYHGCSFHNHT